MAQVEKWLIDTLLRDGRVASLLGAPLQVCPNYLPQGDEHPAIVVRRERTDRKYDSAGPSGGAVTRLIVMCVAKQYPTVKQLAEETRQAIEEAGRLQPDHRDWKIEGAFCEDEFDEEYVPAAAEGAPLFGVRLEIDIHHSETTRCTQ